MGSVLHFFDLSAAAAAESSVAGVESSAAEQYVGAEQHHLFPLLPSPPSEHAGDCRTGLLAAAAVERMRVVFHRGDYCGPAVSTTVVAAALLELC